MKDFNIRILGVSEEDGEDCTIILDYNTRLGLEKGKGLKLRTRTVQGKKQGERPRHIISKLYSRPFKINYLKLQNVRMGRQTSMR